MLTRWKELTPAGALPVSLADAKKHCRVIDSASVAAKANRSMGSGDSQLLVTSKIAGSIGNQYSVRILVSGLNTALTVTFTGNVLTINSATDGTGTATSTVNDVIAAIYALATAAAVFEVTHGAGDGTGLIGAASVGALSGGVDSGDEDAYVGFLIAAATEVVENITNRILIERTIRFFLDEWPDCDEIEIPVLPVQSVESVNYYDLTTEGVLEFEEYYLDIEDKDVPSRIVKVPLEIFPSIMDRPNAIYIDITAGYGPSDTDVPYRMKHCILFLVAHWYANREPVINGTAVLANKIPFTFLTVLNSFRLVSV